MERRFKVQILVTIIIVSALFGTIGTYFFIHNPDNKITVAVVAYVLFMVCLIIPIRKISSNARKAATGN